MSSWTAASTICPSSRTNIQVCTAIQSVATPLLTGTQGGKKILQRVGGKDASKQFWKYHNEAILKKYQGKLQVGTVSDGGSSDSGSASSDAPKLAAAPSVEPGTGSVEPAAAPVMDDEETGYQDDEPEEELNPPMDPFGDLVPYADPNWYQTYHTPYFNQTHADLRAEVREWVDNDIMPNVHEWDEAKKVPDSIYKAMGERGYLAGLLGGKYPTHLVKSPVKSVPPEKWDFFHELLLTDELSRCASGGLVWNLIGGFGIGCPPITRFGSKSLNKRIIPGILAGDKRVCLAITEPGQGSDVANLDCEAKLTPDGKHYIVNGEKKWITNGIWSDYFTTAVRTGPEGSGMNGLSVLLIEREHGGVSTRKMDCQGVWSSGTTYVTFEDVKVPVGNLIGKHNQGFRVIMTNFNHEVSPYPAKP